MTAVTLAPLMPPMPLAPAGARRRRGRPPRVNVDMIAQAVLDVGFVRLTYACVGERLGVSLATLFRHVRGRDELSRLGLDLAIRRHEWPGLDQPWRPLLAAWAESAWLLWADHPGAAVEVSRGVIPPAAQQLTDEVSAALVRVGFTPTCAARAVDLVFDLATDSRRSAETIDTRRGDPHELFAGKLQVVLAGIEAELAPVHRGLADVS